jgi:polyphosphate glucokinase
LDGVLEPMEIGRFHYKKRTLEYYLGARGLKRRGRKKWKREVEKAVARLIEVLRPDDVVLGGGNAKKLKPLPVGTRLGDNAFAFQGGFRMWGPDMAAAASSSGGNGKSRADARELQNKQDPLRAHGKQEQPR